MKNRLKEFRARLNITQEELSLRARVTRQTINAIEKDKYLPSLDLAFRLSKIFNEPVENIFLWEGEEDD